MGTEVGASTEISPGATTLAALQRCVLDYVQGADVPHLQDIVTRAINMGIDKCNAVMWKRLYTTQDITLVALDRDYDLASNVKEAMHCELLDASSRPKGRLHFKAYKTLAEDYPDRVNDGDPCVYSIDHPNRLLVLDRPPSAQWITTYPTIRLWYHKRLARLVNASDTHGGMPEFDRFLCWDARADVSYVRGEAQAGDRATRAAEHIWQLLRVDDKALTQDWPDITAGGGY